MKRILSRHRPYTLIPFIALLCLANDSPAATTQKNGNSSIKAEFTVISLDTFPAYKIKYISEKNIIQPLKFKRKTRSDTYSYKGPPLLYFFKEHTVNATREPVASIKIDPSTKKMLLFFLKNKATTIEYPYEYKIIALEDDLNKFPRGSIKVFNISNHTLTGIVENQQIKLEKYESRIFNPAYHSKPQNTLHFKLATKLKKHYEIAYDNIIRFDSFARTLLILSPPRRKRSIHINTCLIEDYPVDSIKLEAED